ncbi:MAG: beta-lactamase family protein [Caulobacterales bacterium]|nr:beta-lactamase family protein [Caulobacterales bacterium]
MVRLNRRALVAAAAAAVATPSWARRSDGPDAALEAALATPGAPPAMAAGIVTPGGLEWSGVRGVRRVGADEAATSQDRWHIGSNTKAMTAAAYARLVERGLTDWTRPLADVFSDVMIDPAFAATTPDDLTRHIAGLTDPTTLPLLMAARADARPVVEQRAAVVRTALGKPPTGTPGRFAYGNVNYVLLGAVVDRIARRPWEDVIRDEVFWPLGLSGAGLGAPLHDASGLGNAWGHEGPPHARVAVDPATPWADNPPLLGPAGTAHMTLYDYARWLQVMIGGEQTWLSTEGVRGLITPREGQPYARGWITRPETWAGGTTTIAHEGSNTLWHTIAVAAPDKGLGFFVLSNGGLEGRVAAVPLIQKLIVERTT